MINDIDMIAFALWFSWEPFDFKYYDDYKKQWIEKCLPNRRAEHDGDCTNAPYACLRCEMDNWYKKATKIVEDWKRGE